MKEEEEEGPLLLPSLRVSAWAQGTAPLSPPGPFRAGVGGQRWHASAAAAVAAAAAAAEPNLTRSLSCPRSCSSRRSSSCRCPRSSSCWHSAGWGLPPRPRESSLRLQTCPNGPGGQRRMSGPKTRRVTRETAIAICQHGREARGLCSPLCHVKARRRAAEPSPKWTFRLTACATQNERRPELQAARSNHGPVGNSTVILLRRVYRCRATRTPMQTSEQYTGWFLSGLRVDFAACSFNCSPS